MKKTIENTINKHEYIHVIVVHNISQAEGVYLTEQLKLEQKKLFTGGYDRAAKIARHQDPSCKLFMHLNRILFHLNTFKHYILWFRH